MHHTPAPLVRVPVMQGGAQSEQASGELFALYGRGSQVLLGLHCCWCGGVDAAVGGGPSRAVRVHIKSWDSFVSIIKKTKHTNIFHSHHGPFPISDNGFG